MSDRNQDCRDHDEEVADVGDQTEDGEKHANQNCVGQSNRSQGYSDECTINQADHHLPAEEGDQIAIDLIEGADDFVFKFGCAQRQIVTPAVGDFVAFPQEIIQVNRNQE